MGRPVQIQMMVQIQIWSAHERVVKDMQLNSINMAIVA